MKSYMTLKEFADSSGIKYRTLFGWKRKYEDMPVYKIGGSLLVKPNEMDTWLTREHVGGVYEPGEKRVKGMKISKA